MKPSASHSRSAQRPVRRSARWRSLPLLGTFAVGAMLFVGSGDVSAAIVPTVSLATSSNYSVLGGSDVTNTGPSVLAQSLGLWPGTSITGFPPGLVTAPGTTDQTNAAAQQAQSDLTAAYVDAAGRSIDATTTADLANLSLQPGVYSGPSKSPLSLSGPLVLDGGGDPTAVFIFQTDSTLITGSGSTVSLINGAQECNVFWQVGNSATLGTGSVFVGNIMALQAISVQTGVTVHGRALARNAGVTLDNDTFTTPTCDTTTPVTTTTLDTTATTIASGATPTTIAAGPTSAPVDTPVATNTAGTLPLPDLSNVTLPRTGAPVGSVLVFAGVLVASGLLTRRFSRRPDHPR
jgi:hypothetical protein